MLFDEAQIRNFLSEVMDPEVPVLSILDLGIVKNIFSNGEKTEITITPTYTGCPAMKVIEDDIKSKLHEKGIQNVSIKTVYAPAWTTDWISESGKEKLKKYGIAPPEKTSSDKNSLTGKEKKIQCPQCHSLHTEMISQFGSTACKALYKCLDCLEPFDYFKCI
ncbi:MAG: 1,2-phenylacetyl-CoA epoxidase subunit PaaD [Bacteroidia bacterium]